MSASRTWSLENGTQAAVVQAVVSASHYSDHGNQHEPFLIAGVGSETA